MEKELIIGYIVLSYMGGAVWYGTEIVRKYSWEREGLGLIVFFAPFWVWLYPFVLLGKYFARKNKKT